MLLCPEVDLSKPGASWIHQNLPQRLFTILFSAVLISLPLFALARFRAQHSGALLSAFTSKHHRKWTIRTLWNGRFWNDIYDYLYHLWALHLPNTNLLSVCFTFGLHSVDCFGTGCTGNGKRGKLQRRHTIATRPTNDSGSGNSCLFIRCRKELRYNRMLLMIWLMYVWK